MKPWMMGVLAVSLLGLAAVPVQAAKGNKAEGAKTFKTMCASCHGAQGKGDGQAAAMMNPKPTDLTDAKYMATLSDEHLARVIKGGGAAVKKSPLMPALGAKWSDQQVADMIAYLRDLCKCTYKKK